jgi:hypothetical protein
MIGLFCFVLTVLASPFKSRVGLEAENAVLRHQLNVLRRRLPGRARWRLPGMTAERKFSFGFNLIWVVQSLAQKYSGSLLTQITSTTLASRPTHKGRFAIVTNVRSGCDGRGRRD